MTDKEFVLSIYPRVYCNQEYIGNTLYYTVYATRKGHHASIVTFAEKGKTLDEMWGNAKEKILHKTLQVFEK
jgi:hypothetical protein